MPVEDVDGALPAGPELELVAVPDLPSEPVAGGVGQPWGCGVAGVLPLPPLPEDGGAPAEPCADDSPPPEVLGVPPLGEDDPDDGVEGAGVDEPEDGDWEPGLPLEPDVVLGLLEGDGRLGIDGIDVELVVRQPPAPIARPAASNTCVSRAIRCVDNELP